MRGTAFALRELLVHGTHVGTEEKWSWLPPREKQMEICPKEHNSETNFEKWIYSCPMPVPDIDTQIDFAWQIRASYMPTRHLDKLHTQQLRQAEPIEYGAIVVGMSPFTGPLRK